MDIKITYKTQEGEILNDIFSNVKRIEIIGKDSDRYRLKQDFERGIEVTAEGNLVDKLYVEPRCANQVTLFTKEYKPKE